MASRRIQLSSYIRVCKGKPNSPRTLIAFQTILPHRPEGCTRTLESSRTLKIVGTCFHDVQTDATLHCLKLLDTNGSPDGIPMSSRQILLTDEHLDALRGRPNENKGSNFCLVGICTESSWNSEISVLKLVTLKLVTLRPFPYQSNKL
jgi:hypothetical protein